MSFLGHGLLGSSWVGNGVWGSTFSLDPGHGAVHGTSSTTFAGLFEGDVHITGNLSKGGGGFTVDHPLDPHNKYLSHSFVESPDMLNIYSGTVITDSDGEAVVGLPDYFEAANEEFRYQLTAIEQFAQIIVAEGVRDNRFVIKSDKPEVQVCWQVTGIRKDAWAVSHRIKVEGAKKDINKSRYFHPEVWGKNEEVNQFTQNIIDRMRPVQDVISDELETRLEELLVALRGGPMEVEQLRGLAEDTRKIVEKASTIGLQEMENQWREVQNLIEDMPLPKTGKEE